MIYMTFPDWKQRAFTMSYDDGVVEDKKLIEIMKSNGIKGTFNLNSGLAGNTRRLPISEYKSLYLDNEMEIALHGAIHYPLDYGFYEDMFFDLYNDKVNLEKVTEKPIRGCAYAQGHCNDKAVDILRNLGVVYSRSVKCTESFNIPTDWLRLEATCHHYNPKLFELINKFLTDNLEETPWRYRNPYLFYLWGHSYEFENNHNWDIIEKVCEIIGRADSVWKATNIVIYDYVMAYNSLIFSADKTIVQNNSNLDLFFILNGIKYKVPKCSILKLN